MTVEGLNGLGRVTKVGITLKWRKPSKIIENPRTWGEYLKNRRLELGLTVAVTARRFKVVFNTLNEWEHDRVSFRPMYYPRVIEFLGHIPPLFPMETLGQKIIAYRLIHGYSQTKFSQILKVNICSLQNWEEGKSEPNEENRKKLQRLFDSMETERL